MSNCTIFQKYIFSTFESSKFKLFRFLDDWNISIPPATDVPSSFVCSLLYGIAIWNLIAQRRIQPASPTDARNLFCKCFSAVIISRVRNSYKLSWLFRLSRHSGFPVISVFSRSSFPGCFGFPVIQAFRSYWLSVVQAFRAIELSGRSGLGALVEP